MVRYAEHFGTPEMTMSWWLFLSMLGQVEKVEARALLRAIEGPALAINRLFGGEANWRLGLTLEELAEKAS